MSGSQKNKLLIIGPNGIGRVFIRLCQQYGDTIAGVIASSPPSSNDFVNRYNSLDSGNRARAFSYFREALEATEFDGVVIASPAGSHYGFLSQALQAGLPVLCEKPLISFDGEVEENLLALSAFDDQAQLIFNASNHHFVEQLPGLADAVQKAKSFVFKFHSNGQHTHQKIIEDLLPHCVSFLQKLVGDFSAELTTCTVEAHAATGTFSYGPINVSFDFAQGATANKTLAFGCENNIYLRHQSGQGESYQVSTVGPLRSTNDAVGEQEFIAQVDPFETSYNRFRNLMDRKDDTQPSSDLSWAIANHRICLSLLRQIKTQRGAP